MKATLLLLFCLIFAGCGDEVNIDDDDEIVEIGELVLAPLLQGDVLFEFLVRDDETAEWVTIMKFDQSGDIYHRGKLIITDQELVEGLRDIVVEYRCPKCKEKLDYFKNKKC